MVPESKDADRLPLGGRSKSTYDAAAQKLSIKFEPESEGSWIVARLGRFPSLAEIDRLGFENHPPVRSTRRSPPSRTRAFSLLLRLNLNFAVESGRTAEAAANVHRRRSKTAYRCWSQRSRQSTLPQSRTRDSQRSLRPSAQFPASTHVDKSTQSRRA